MTTKPLLGIRDILETFNCSPDTLRFYEELGLVQPVVIGRQRFYDPKDEIRLNLIACGKRLGFSLREIKDLIVEHTPVPAPAPDREIAKLSDHRTQGQAALVEVRDVPISSGTNRKAALI